MKELSWKQCLAMLVLGTLVIVVVGMAVRQPEMLWEYLNPPVIFSLLAFGAVAGLWWLVSLSPKLSRFVLTRFIVIVGCVLVAGALLYASTQPATPFEKILAKSFSVAFGVAALLVVVTTLREIYLWLKTSLRS